MTADDFIERVVSQREIFRGRSFVVHERMVEIQPEEVQRWEVLEKPAGVAIVAIDDHLTLTLVEEYLAGIDRRGLTLPKGAIEPGEDPEAAARRELQEEAGLVGSLEPLGQFAVSPSYQTQVTHLFLAVDVRPTGRGGDELQYLEPRQLSVSRALEMCFEGLFPDARTVAGIFMAARRLGLLRT